MDSIILMGIKHCGKSTQARLVSKELGLENFDTDDLVEQETGKTPRQIYVSEGEGAFKNAEARVCLNLKNLLEKNNSKAVIATGGGICNNPEAIQILKSMGKCVFLQADEKLAADRIVREVVVDETGKLSNLPAYIAKKNPCSINEVREVFHQFYVERTKVYSEIADVTVVMQNASKSVNTKCIIAAIEAV